MAEAMQAKVLTQDEARDELRRTLHVCRNYSGAGKRNKVEPDQGLLAAGVDRPRSDRGMVHSNI